MAIYLSLSALMVVRQALILVGGCQSWFAGGKWANGQHLRIFTILPSPPYTSLMFSSYFDRGIFEGTNVKPLRCVFQAMCISGYNFLFAGK